MTVHDMELTGFGYAGSCRHLEMMEDLHRTDGFDDIRNLALHWKSRWTYHVQQYSIEMKINSMKNDDGMEHTSTNVMSRLPGKP